MSEFHKSSPGLRRALRASGRLGVAISALIVAANGALTPVRPVDAGDAASPRAEAPAIQANAAVWPVAPAEPSLPPVTAPLTAGVPAIVLPPPDLIGPPIAPPEPTATPEQPAPTPRPATATPIPPTASPLPATPTAVRPTASAVPTAPGPRPAFKRPPLPLKGIGYNPTYATANVPRELRAERLRRDMAEMAQTGITMVLGWEPGVFDQELIDAAAANGIGVLLPFELRPEYNYAEPQTRAQLIEQALAWIERYRDQPAVIMWAIGNEVTLPMDGEQRRAYADFYAELFGRVHAADPTRPVIIREAEDVFVNELAEAFVRRGLATQRGDAIKGPDGFVYGVNFYTDRVGPALADWVENTGFDVPVLVSEYAPAGAGHRARADRFAQMHASIAAAGPRVVGSAPYTWTTIGPEAVDSYFGLVDGDGRPVDGALAELARLYGVEPPEWTRVTATDEQIARAAELPQLFDAALDVAKRQAARDPDTLRANAEAEAAAAVRELGVADASGVTAERTRSVAELIGWAKELSDVRRDDERLFPGLREALPLLNGMARWTTVEPSAAETARTFLATVLRRDLKALSN